MIRLHYRLNQENFKELNSYLALNDKKMQKKLLTIICSSIVFVIVLCYIIFQLPIYTLLMSVAGIVFIVVFMPKIYWNMVFHRADHFVENTKIEYNEIRAEISDRILIQEKNTRITILFEDIVKFDYTRNNCILFYKDNEKINTLILPVNSFSEEQLKEFHLKLMEKDHEKTRNN